jgi:hypothetical protein
MHELLVELFPWVVVLWGVDGLVQLGRGHLLLVRGGWGGFRLREAGLHLVLSPLAEAVVAHDLPVLASRDRVFLFDPRRRSEPALVAGADLEALPRDALSRVEREGRKVRLAGRVVVAAPTAEWAERIRRDLAALAGGPAAAPDRGLFLLAKATHEIHDKLEVRHEKELEGHDLRAALALRARQRPFVGALRAAASLLFALTFVAWPLAAHAPAAAPLAPGVVLAGVGLVVLGIAALVFAMLVGCGEPPSRSAACALHLALYPVAALRPLVHGGRSLYRRFDAMTVAAALLPRERFGVLAARELRRARLSRDATAPELAGCWDDRAGTLARLLGEIGVPEAEALAPPPRGGDAAAWCPLCRGQYRAGYERCGDCGVRVEPFAA